MQTIHRATTESSPNAELQKSVQRGALIVLILGIAVIILLLALAALANDSASTADVTPRPFGPGWAADYGTFDAQGNDLPGPRPFGPGVAADYGTFDAQGNDLPGPRPFGPGVAADYGIPVQK